MKKYPGLIRDKKSGIFSFRKRLPENLRPLMGNKYQIKISLRTKDEQKALSQYYVECMRFQNLLKEKHYLLNKGNAAKGEVTKSTSPLDQLSEAEIMFLIYEWMKEAEMRGRTPKEEVYDGEIEEALGAELNDIEEEMKRRDYFRGEYNLKRVLEKNNIDFDTQSAQFQNMLEVATLADYEVMTRMLQYHRNPALVTGTGDYRFKKYNSIDIKDRSGDLKFNKFCDLYFGYRKDLYGDDNEERIRQEVNVLKELIPPNIYISDITPLMCREVFEKIKQIPANAKKNIRI